MREVPATPPTYVVIATDGLPSAGRRGNGAFDMEREVRDFFELGGHGAEHLAEALLGRALEADAGRPADDISVLVVAVVDRESTGIRRLVTRVPYAPSQGVPGGS
jgi:serine phosphatase RsbU (regulator of sigma subunit)